MDASDYEYYEIDLNDIIQYERNQISEKKLDEKGLNKLYENIYDEYLERGRTIVKEAGNNEYFENRENRYVNTIKIEDKLSLGYFVSGNNIYPINESLIIPVEHLKFEYFFALKLRQYEGGQKYIEEYLNYYHLKFIESKLDFNKLLKIVLMQYEEIIDKRVIELCTEWRLISLNDEGNKKTNKIIKSKEEKALKTFNSFLLKKKIDREDAKTMLTFSKLREQLTYKKYLISSSGDTRKFIDIFTNSYEESAPLFQWSNIRTLHCFVDLLFELKLVESMKNDRWFVCTKIFYIETPGDLTAKKLTNNYRFAEEDERRLKAILETTISKL